MVLTALDLAMADLPVDTMATAVLAHVEPLEDHCGVRVRWSNAGHPPPVLLLPDGTAEPMAAKPGSCSASSPASTAPTTRSRCRRGRPC
ncbi:hypothetical protein GCM10025868_21390 [Angustibacter aerolatus]|uniref:PPM-type phosphatase domain-containing protein n=1 Tax=Angustibacter aerolatus TaxID=1162965 RepID=A0ABQ6JHP6_9ACTN|nr:hypothetical protein GCM10025868_21390 [Angustibacter aerolatus]